MKKSAIIYALFVTIFCVKLYSDPKDKVIKSREAFTYIHTPWDGKKLGAMYLSGVIRSGKAKNSDNLRMIKDLQINEQERHCIKNASQYYKSIFTLKDLGPDYLKAGYSNALVFNLNRSSKEIWSLANNTTVIDLYLKNDSDCEFVQNETQLYSFFHSKSIDYHSVESNNNRLPASIDSESHPSSMKKKSLWAKFLNLFKFK